MGLWLLSFTGKSIAVIIKAETLSHARLLAVANGFCRASSFDEAYAIDPHLTIVIPEDFIGRKLSRDDVADILQTLMVALLVGRNVGTDLWQPARVLRPALPFFDELTHVEAVARPSAYQPDQECQNFPSAISDASHGSCAFPIDDLSEPLGMSRKPERARQPIFAYLAAAGLFGMAIAGFAIWHAAPTKRSSIVVPAPHHSAAAFLPNPSSELLPRDTGSSAGADTSLPVEPVTVEKAQEVATEADAETLKADPDQHIITIIDGRNGTRRQIRVPATSTPGSR
jgi:hypothetical protein